MFKPLLYSITLAIVLCLTGCAVSQLNQAERVSASAQQYLEQAEQATGTQRQQYQMLAVNQMLADNNLNDANQLLNSLNIADLNPAIASQRDILLARLVLAQNDPRRALTQLQRVRQLKSLPVDAQKAYYLASIEAHLRLHDVAYSTLARISLNGLLTDEQAVYQNRKIIWYNLQTLPIPTLETLLNRSDTSLLQGWLELALLARNHADEPQRLVSGMQAWQKAFPNHPANALLPTVDQLQSLLQTKPPQKVVLLLPIHGPFAKMGQALRDGFITAFYADKQTTKKPTIQVMDTSQSTSVEDLYQQAVDQGAQFVIGPLTKQNVAELASEADISVPTVVLNYLPKDANVPQNLVEFGLAPEPAAEQAADYAWQMGVNNILMIAPQGDRSDKIRTAFLNRWQSLGGTVTANLVFTTKAQLATDIQAALNITQSQQRANDLAKLLGEKFKFVARRRQDIQGIFLAANSSQARQINPLLRFYYAGDLPIFSVPDIYNGYPNARRDIDLNGIYFVDAPWLLQKSGNIPALRQQIQSAWPSNYQANNRLYGLGVDSYQLMTLLPRLMVLPNFALHGAMGQLYLNANHRIYRQLNQAQFNKGLAVARSLERR